MNFDPNPLFYEMAKLLANRPKDDKITIFNEGGSRSSKTWDFFHLIVFYCDQFRGGNQEIYCHRDTLTNCRDYTLKDFINCLKQIGVFEPSKLTNVAQKPYYNLFGNHIFFRGLDDEKSMEGYPSDIAFFNELLEVESESKISGIKMRCRKLIVADWNPKFTSHWAFKYEGRPNTYFTKTTFRNNKHCPPAVINEILSYEPTHPEDRELPENERRPHPTNIKNGTADSFRWKVYGLGERGAMEGLVFPYVEYIDSFPDMAFIYGLDFGFTQDPNTLVKFAEDSESIYLELLIYEPVDNSDALIAALENLGVSKKTPISCDSSDKYVSENKGAVEMVSALQDAGYSAFKVSKTKSVMFWIGEMKKKKIKIVNNKLVHHAKTEQENYIYRKVNGIAINQPIDKFNHFWDASRYAKIEMSDSVDAFIV